MLNSEVLYVPHPTISILSRISVSQYFLQFVLSKPWHLFVTMVYGPVAKSSAFCLKALEVTNPKHWKQKGSMCGFANSGGGQEGGEH